MSFIKKLKNAIVPSASGAGVGALVGGLPGAAIGALAGAGMSYMSDTQADKQNKLAQASIDRANAYDLRMWNLANLYNDPKAQMQRLADAGLNPNLVYGGGNVTGNTTSAPGSNGSAESYVADKVGNSIQAAQMMANLNHTRAITALTDAQAITADNEAQVSSYNRDYADAEYQEFLETGIPPQSWRDGGLTLANKVLSSTTGRSGVGWLKFLVDKFNDR